MSAGRNQAARGPGRRFLRIPCGSLAGGLRLALQSSPCRRISRPTDTGRTTDMSTNTTKSTTARKVVGSLGVLGAAAAVAGIGTFGGFTDSTPPVSTTISSGTLSIDLTQPSVAIPASTVGFVPGDSLTRAVNLVNDGNSALGSVTLSST